MGAANPAAIVDRLRCLRRVGEELFEAGGAVIESPAGQPVGATVAARTVIQPDGDVLHFVHDGRDAVTISAHLELVAAWYRRVSDAFGAVQALLGATGQALATILGVVAAVITTVTAGLVTGLVVLVAVPLVLRLATRLTVRFVTRRVRRSLAG
jgi:hypothetical protein